MKPESLNALLLDRELGELTPEAAELLDAWLAEHPESAAVVPSIRRTLDTTSTAVRRFPKLAQPEADRPTPNVIAFLVSHFRGVPLAWAASIMILLGASAWLGFRASQESPRTSTVAIHRQPVTALPASAAKQDGPWARYALASDPRGGLTIVRRDIHPQPAP